MKDRSSKFEFYSLALDEKPDVTDIAQVVNFICDVDEAFDVKGELTALISLKETTKSRDLLEAVQSTSNRFALKFYNLSAITRDGKHEGLVKSIKGEAFKVCNTSMLNFH